MEMTTNINYKEHIFSGYTSYDIIVLFRRVRRTGPQNDRMRREDAAAAARKTSHIFALDHARMLNLTEWSDCVPNT
jgi:hypothetical protein